jgi:2-phosphoglycolate phosphatase
VATGAPLPGATSARLRAVLFDLDGTVLDTAPDMAAALNALRREEGLAPVAFELIRPCVSHGASRVVGAGFSNIDRATFTRLQQRFLEIYRSALSAESRLFPGMDGVLSALAARGLLAGIVTNKAGWLTEPLLEQLGLRRRFACVVSGDSVAERKPHPLPLLHAAALLGVSSRECIFVGDAERDIQAARAAGMPGLIARYGYVPADEDPDAWRGDGDLAEAADLIGWLDASGRL